MDMWERKPVSSAKGYRAKKDGHNRRRAEVNPSWTLRAVERRKKKKDAKERRKPVLGQSLALLTQRRVFSPSPPPLLSSPLPSPLPSPPENTAASRSIRAGGKVLKHRPIYFYATIPEYSTQFIIRLDKRKIRFQKSLKI